MKTNKICKLTICFLLYTIGMVFIQFILGFGISDVWDKLKNKVDQ